MGWCLLQFGGFADGFHSSVSAGWGGRVQVMTGGRPWRCGTPSICVAPSSSSVAMPQALPGAPLCTPDGLEAGCVFWQKSPWSFKGVSH